MTMAFARSAGILALITLSGGFAQNASECITKGYKWLEHVSSTVISDVDAQTWQECQTFCQFNPGCAGWTFRPCDHPSRPLTCMIFGAFDEGSYRVSSAEHVSCAGRDCIDCSAPATAPPEPAPTSNSNLCITSLPGIATCSAGPGVECCEGVRSLTENLCSCNPVVYDVLPTASQIFNDLTPVCRALYPDEWEDVRINPDCSKAYTFNYGCPGTPDMVIDQRRLNTIRRFVAAIDLQQNVDSPAGACMNVTLFAEGLSTAIYEHTTLYVPWGIGNYQGAYDIAEYLAISFESLNHGVWRVERRVSLGAFFTPTGVTTASTWVNTFLDGLLPEVPATPFLFSGEFAACDTERATSLNVAPNVGSRDIFQVGLWTLTSQRWGITDICRAHELYCAPDPATRQFDSTDACLAYMESLPLYSEACGQNRPYAGLSLPCKWKHHFMIQVNPEAHCPHIGVAGVLDMDGSAKCTDDYGCSVDEGQDAWPPLDMYGENTPQEIIDLIAQSDIGSEDEDLGCVE